MSDGLIPIRRGPCRRGRHLSRDDRAAGRRRRRRHRRCGWRAGQASIRTRYRALFRRVGARWLWFSRLAMDDAAAGRDAPADVHAVLDRRRRRDAGLLELDFREAGLCHDPLPRPGARAGRPGPWPLAVRRGAAARLGARRRAGRGPHLLARSSGRLARLSARRLQRAADGPSRAFPDPRLAGLLPRDAAPQLPLVEGSGDAGSG